MARNALPTRQKPGKKTPKRAPGARVSHTSLSDRMEAWWLHHRASARDAWQRMLRSPVGTLMTVTVIAIALSLPSGLSVMLDNLHALTKGWDGNAHLSVFFNKDVPLAEQQSLLTAWESREEVSHARLISPDAALTEFREFSGFGEVLDALPDNPLPPLVMVFPTETSPETLARLHEVLAAEPAVDLVQLDIEWVRRLQAMVTLAARVVSALALGLAMAVVLVVVNTIRLAIENRREEIVVVKMVGGTDAFVRRPFLYTGFWYGLAGGILSLLLVQTTLWWLSGPFNELMALYDSEYTLLGMDLQLWVLLPLHAGLLGLIGAWLAVARHLRDVDPQQL